jgi:hypothetical protein
MALSLNLQFRVLCLWSANGWLRQPYQSSAKSVGIDAGDGQRDEVNTRCLQDISKIEY